MPAAAAQGEPVIEISGLCTRFGDHVVHADLELEVRRAEIFALIGGSGSGKSTLLREMILLHRPDAGSIRFSYFHDLFGRLHLGSDDIITVFRRDGERARIRKAIQHAFAGEVEIADGFEFGHGRRK